MLDKPPLQDEKIIACLEQQFSLHIAHLTFLALGADPHTAVYRATTSSELAFFVKLRQGSFDEMSVALPKFLYQENIPQIIPPLATTAGQLWANIDSYTLLVYPFVEGKDAYAQNVTDEQWIEFGAALHRIHNTIIPVQLRARLPNETFSPIWRKRVQTFLQDIPNEPFRDEIQSQTSEFLDSHRAEILDLVERAEQYGNLLAARAQNFVLCHSDLHAGNLFLAAHNKLYIVDWDNPILAPKERDLMFVGGGQFGNKRTPAQEKLLFYQGYGKSEIDEVALAYYRYERIVQDIAVEYEQIFSNTVGAQDRTQEFEFMKWNFLPCGTIETAYAADKSLLHH